jgi:predicted deacylase
MQRLGKNLDGYSGETIDIRAILGDMEAVAAQNGWGSEVFYQKADFKWLALQRAASRRSTECSPDSSRAPRIYISAGIHGDEPAGPLAMLRLLRENQWPDTAELWLCPCLNPPGFALNRRENDQGIDLNRQYLHLAAEETRAHIAWLNRQPGFDLCLCLHEDWEAHGFYVYELNLGEWPLLAEAIVDDVAKVCPLDLSEMIEGRPAKGGVIRPNADPRSRPEWPEAFYLLTHKTRLSCTLEAPSDYSLDVRVNALVAGVTAALNSVS